MQPVIESEFVEGVGKARLWFIERERHDDENRQEHVTQHEDADQKNQMVAHPDACFVTLGWSNRRH
jgi:hypothetical protein